MYGDFVGPGGVCLIGPLEETYYSHYGDIKTKIKFTNLSRLLPTLTVLDFTPGTTSRFYARLLRVEEVTGLISMYSYHYGQRKLSSDRCDSVQ